ncbi:MAG TPA: hypothetical protein VJN02_07980 [Gammaproteobacteria bacterium]|nr:hypothetical protein [Gammaproteobacteria bacterium]
MSDPLKTKHKWPYDGNLEPLQDYLHKHIEYAQVTLIMTQAEYDEFYDDTDAETLAANRFRPIDLTTNECKPEWLFDGRLKLFFKIKEEN